MKLQVVDARGQATGELEVDDAVFGIEPNGPVVHQVLLAQLAARRAGTASTKNRGEVRGSTRKIRRQKGLGMARQGAIRAPQHRGGGVVFGPRPRSFAQRLPKRMRRLAIRSVLSSRAADERLVVVEGLEVSSPSTKEMKAVLAALGVDRSAMILTEQSDRGVLLSVRNLPGMDTCPVDTLGVAEVLAHRHLVMTVGAVRRAEALWGGERASSRRAELPAVASAGGD